MSKYQPLADYLSELSVDRVGLSFAEIERVLGEPLPLSARNHAAWWANSRTADSHTWAHLWIGEGWEVDSLSLPNSNVEFRRFQYFDVESKEAIEGYEFDRKILSRHRNAGLVRQRKELDKYECKACGFSLNILGKWIIEVHHLYPFRVTGETITTINDLVSLCPTCHRISHTKNLPYTVNEIKTIVGSL